MKQDLERVREWAQAKVQGGEQPPWAWYQYMKLIETVDAILAGMAATIPMGSLQQSQQHPDGHLRLVDSTCPRDTSQPHPVGLPIQMPM